jgi:hypothetical protein
VTSALVVVESMFGNTRAVADAVAAGLSESVPTTVVEVSTAPSRTGVDLLVVGGPTHALGLSRRATREDAVRQGAVDAGVQVGIREWLQALPHQPGTAVATFDTRVRKRGVPGSAARSAMRRLRSRGMRPLHVPQTFWVTRIRGPLVDGELQQARDWGRLLAHRLAERAARPAPRR